MKVLIISDLHYDKRIFRGVDESKAWSWLVEVVDYHKPGLLLSCGDWGTAISFEEFYALLKKVIVLTIYGNHENMNVLTKLYNVKTNEYLPVLMEDARIYEYAGLRIAGINGIIAKKKKVRRGVPRRTPDEYVGYAEKLEGNDVDILLLHETPYLPNLFPFMRDGFTSRAALEAVKIAKPKLVINGHMHCGGFKTYVFDFGTRYVYISSDQKERCYIVCNVDGAKLEVWRDFDLVTYIDLRE